jgi:hypothetical protein
MRPNRDPIKSNRIAVQLSPADRSKPVPIFADHAVGYRYGKGVAKAPRPAD